MVALSRASEETIGQDFRALERTAREFLDNSKTAIERDYANRWADVRYVGQPHEVPVSVPPGPVGLERLYADFERRHERLYGTKLKDDAEIVNIRVTVTGQVPRLRAPASGANLLARRSAPRLAAHRGLSHRGEGFGALHPRRHHRRGSIRQRPAEGRRGVNDDAREAKEAGLDPFSAEILRNYLLSAVKEMVSLFHLL
jgi:N-methylhydantoinase A